MRKIYSDVASLGANLYLSKRNFHSHPTYTHTCAQRHLVFSPYRSILHPTLNLHSFLYQEALQVLSQTWVSSRESILSSGVRSNHFGCFQTPNQGSNPNLLHCRLILYHLNHLGNYQAHYTLIYQGCQTLKMQLIILFFFFQPPITPGIFQQLAWDRKFWRHFSRWIAMKLRIRLQF